MATYSKETVAALDALQSPNGLPSEDEIYKWSGAVSYYSKGPTFMARVLQWRVDNPDADLPACIAELERRGG